MSSLHRTELRSLRVLDRTGLRQTERLWHTARVVIGSVSIRARVGQWHRSTLASS